MTIDMLQRVSISYLTAAVLLRSEPLTSANGTLPPGHLIKTCHVYNVLDKAICFT